MGSGSGVVTAAALITAVALVGFLAQNFHMQWVWIKKKKNQKKPNHIWGSGKTLRSYNIGQVIK